MSKEALSCSYDNEILTNDLQGTKIKCCKVSRVLFKKIWKVITKENSTKGIKPTLTYK